MLQVNRCELGKCGFFQANPPVQTSFTFIASQCTTGNNIQPVSLIFEVVTIKIYTPGLAQGKPKILLILEKSIPMNIQ
jgi:hypothetical protein